MLAAFTACQKDEGLVSDTTAASSFTVTIPQSGVQTLLSKKLEELL